MYTSIDYLLIYIVGYATQTPFVGRWRDFATRKYVHIIYMSVDEIQSYV